MRLERFVDALNIRVSQKLSEMQCKSPPATVRTLWELHPLLPEEDTCQDKCGMEEETLEVSKRTWTETIAKMI